MSIFWGERSWNSLFIFISYIVGGGWTCHLIHEQSIYLTFIFIIFQTPFSRSTLVHQCGSSRLWWPKIWNIQRPFTGDVQDWWDEWCYDAPHMRRNGQPPRPRQKEGLAVANPLESAPNMMRNHRRVHLKMKKTHTMFIVHPNERWPLELVRKAL